MTKQSTRLENACPLRHSALVEDVSGGQCFLQIVIDEIPESLMVIDSDFRIVLANRAARREAGPDSLSSGNAKCYEISHRRSTPCEGDEHPCPVRRVLESRSAVTVTHTHFDADGNEHLMEIVAGPILDEHGNVVRVIESMRDVTARVRAEELARTRQAELAHVARLATMGELAAGLAHELNQPLSAIVNYTQACLERIRSGADDSAELLEDMQRAALQAERAGEIIEHIRGFARKGEPRLVPTNLNTLVRSATQLLADRLGRDSVRLDLALADSLPPIAAVPIQIEQVIVNLIHNGVEAMAEAEAAARVLSIGTSASNGTVQCMVRDRGPGLSDGVLERMFDPFFTTKSNGLGMGLSISWSIIESHGGRLSARSDADRGATLIFTLPVSGGGHQDEP